MNAESLTRMLRAHSLPWTRLRTEAPTAWTSPRRGGAAAAERVAVSVCESAWGQDIVAIKFRVAVEGVAPHRAFAFLRDEPARRPEWDAAALHSGRI